MLITAPTINNGDPIDPSVVQAFIDQVDALRRGNVDNDNMQDAKPWCVVPLKGWHLGPDDAGIGYVDMEEGPAYTMIPFRIAPQETDLAIPKKYFRIDNVLVVADAWSTSETMAVELWRYTDETYTVGAGPLLTATLTSTAGPFPTGHELQSAWAETGGDRFIYCEATHQFYAWHLYKVNRASLWRSVSIQGEVWYYPFRG